MQEFYYKKFHNKEFKNLIKIEKYHKGLNFYRAFPPVLGNE